MRPEFRAPDSSSAYSFTLAWVCCNCATTRIEQARDIKERILEGAQTNNRRHIILFDEHADLGFIFRDVLEKIRSWRLEFLCYAGCSSLQNV
jgi:hypothetical protein